jgi:hypothetical protein
MKFISQFLLVLCVALVAFWMILSALGCLQVLAHAIGLFGVIAGIFLFPVAIFLVPIYALFVDHNWQLIAWVFGGGFLSQFILGASMLLRKSFTKQA